MRISRTTVPVEMLEVEVLEGANWHPSQINSKNCLILTDVTDSEHDQLIGIMNQDELRGIMVSMYVDSCKEEGPDPELINLVAIPQKGQVIRHQDQYYQVNMVVLSSSCTAAIFVSRLPEDIKNKIMTRATHQLVS